MVVLPPSTSPPLSRHTGANRYPERQGGAGPFPLSPVEGGSRRIDGSPASPFPRERGKVRMGVLATNHPRHSNIPPPSYRRKPRCPCSGRYPETPRPTASPNPQPRRRGESRLARPAVRREPDSRISIYPAPNPVRPEPVEGPTLTRTPRPNPNLPVTLVRTHSRKNEQHGHRYHPPLHAGPRRRGPHRRPHPVRTLREVVSAGENICLVAEMRHRPYRTNAKTTSAAATGTNRMPALGVLFPRSRGGRACPVLDTGLGWGRHPATPVAFDSSQRAYL